MQSLAFPRTRHVLTLAFVAVAMFATRANAQEGLTGPQVLFLGRMAANSETSWGLRPVGFEFRLDPALAGTTSRAWASLYSDGNCVIGVGPEFWDDALENDAQRQTLITHEWGHCLGLPDSYGTPGVIMGLSSSTITDLDRATLRLLRGQKIPMMAND